MAARTTIQVGHQGVRGLFGPDGEVAMIPTTVEETAADDGNQH